MMLSLSGGLVGALLGITVTFVVAQAAGWQAVFVGKPLFLAVASSAAIGLLFGTIPARKASMANPVNSLRAE
jgi:putative ABC transport system permease protein